MFVYLTNVILDITVGITWWITKNTCYTFYNGITYIFSKGYNSLNDTSEKNNSEDKINNSIVIIESEELFDKILSLSKKENLCV